MSSDTESACESSPYTEYFDKMFLRSKETIYQEKSFLGESTYTAGNYKISTGISVARGMIPSVKLSTNQDVQLSFCVEDWLEFLQIVDHMMSVEETYFKVFQSEEFTISSATFATEKAIKLQGYKNSLYFSSTDIDSFNDVKDLVNYKLQVLKQLDFKNMYDHFLWYAYAFSATKENLLSIVKAICNLNTTESNCCILQLMQYNPTKLLEDYEKILVINNE